MQSVKQSVSTEHYRMFSMWIYSINKCLLSQKPEFIFPRDNRQVMMLGLQYSKLFTVYIHTSQLATELGYSGCFFFAKCNFFLLTIPSSLKTDYPQKIKPFLSRSTWGRSLQSF